ncbi:YdiY family protein [Planctomycetota bacterium]
MARILRFGFIFILTTGWCYGDEVIFKNGDKLTGEIKSLVGGKLVIDTAVAGEVTVDIANVSTFSSDKTLEIHLKDGTVLNQAVEEDEQGRISTVETDILKGQNLSLDSLGDINPPPKPEPKWTGDVSAGITATRGNTVTDRQDITINATKRTEKDRTILGFDYNKGKQEDPSTGIKETTEDNWQATGKYDYFLSDKVYLFGNTRYEKDSIAQLDRRVIVGGGGGYQWVETDDMNFRTEAGLASLYEKYDNQTDSTTELSAQAGYYFDKKLTKDIKFIHQLTYYPSLEQYSDYFLTTNTELRAFITERLFTNFRVVFDYDSTPAAGVSSTDTKYIWGVGWSF